jgi:hypothetical protein
VVIMPKKSTDATARPATRRRAAGGASTAGAADDSDVRNPTHAEIAEAAYRRYLNRGGEHGRDFDDWLEAEQELRQQESQ